jgi:hypothetical protein
VPPRDGNGGPSDDEDGLVAQIIPLRRREREPEKSQSPSFPVPGVAGDEPPAARRMPPPAERSVWDPPTAELRRRRAEPGSPAQSARAPRPLASRRSWRVAAVSAVAAAAGAATLVLVLTGGPGGRSRHAPKEAASATLKASSTATGHSVIKTQPFARRARHTRGDAAAHHRQQTRARALHVQHQQSPSPAAQDAAAESVAANSQAAAPPSATPHQTAASSNTESTPATARSEGAAAAETPAAAAPSASTSSTPQNQCVPGELGC